MRVTVVGPNGKLRSYLKGAAEEVLQRCSLTPEALRSFRARAELEAARGFKVLGLAAGAGDSETELSFLGLVTLWDPPRPEAAAAVRAAREAGISVLMITGDHPETARAIGEKVGILSERVLTGAELDALSSEELERTLASVTIFSRMLPEHKLRIVEALQARGEVVAMTGDGLNDAPALKRADIGVAMGQRGSAVAREVSDVVLLDDNFSTIVSAVQEGRVIYENIVNFIRFTSSSNVALMLLVLGGAVGSLFLGLRTAEGALLLPLTALQVLWINFLGDGPPALALSVDRCPNVMQEPPRPRSAPLLERSTLRFILIDGTFKGAVGLALLWILPNFGLSLSATATSVFLYESIAKLASAYPARKVGAVPVTNRWLHVSIASGILLSLACALVHPLRLTLGLSAIDLGAIRYVLLASLLTALSGEVLARALKAKSVPKLVRA
jgi:Ca2+-transporting ATPase